MRCHLKKRCFAVAWICLLAPYPGHVAQPGWSCPGLDLLLDLASRRDISREVA